MKKILITIVHFYVARMARVLWSVMVNSAFIYLVCGCESYFRRPEVLLVTSVWTSDVILIQWAARKVVEVTSEWA